MGGGARAPKPYFTSASGARDWERRARKGPSRPIGGSVGPHPIGLDHLSPFLTRARARRRYGSLSPVARQPGAQRRQRELAAVRSTVRSTSTVHFIARQATQACATTGELPDSSTRCRQASCSSTPLHLPTPHATAIPRVAGEHLEPGRIVRLAFRTTTLPVTSGVQAGVHAREAAALRLNHLEMSHWAR